jgi:REP element-mobilizing transposase RayT
MRIDIPDIPFHVFARGNNREAIFFDEKDRIIYLKLLRDLRQELHFDLYTYALMDNHIHLLLTMRNESRLAKLMHALHFTYASYINRKYGRVGHVFQGRYKGLPIQSDRYFLTVDRYIHLNAPRAGLVQRPEDYPWSSYKARLSGYDSDWINHTEILDYFGEDAAKRLQEYQAFTESALGTPEEWSHDILQKASCLGDAGFLRGILIRNDSRKRTRSLLSAV